MNCQHIDLPHYNYYGNVVECQNEAVSRDPHGWMCPEHFAQNEQSRVTQYKVRVQRDVDLELVRGIIASERRAIASGDITRISYGALEPVSIRFWSKPRVH